MAPQPAHSVAILTRRWREHRGSIRLSSTPGAGTTFRVLFPAVPAGSPAVPQAETRPDRGGSGTVLVVDDDDMVRRTARIMRLAAKVKTALEASA